jgi:hypothetical protein
MRFAGGLFTSAEKIFPEPVRLICVLDCTTGNTRLVRRLSFSALRKNTEQWITAAFSRERAADKKLDARFPEQQLQPRACSHSCTKVSRSIPEMIGYPGCRRAGARKNYIAWGRLARNEAPVSWRCRIMRRENSGPNFGGVRRASSLALVLLFLHRGPFISPRPASASTGECSIGSGESPSSGR